MPRTGPRSAELPLHSSRSQNRGNGRGQEEGGGCCSFLLSILCIFLLWQAWEGESDGWQCQHPIQAGAGGTGTGTAPSNIGRCELRRGQPSGYEAACLDAKTNATCADLVQNCVWNPTAPSLPSPSPPPVPSPSPVFSDDNGAGHKLTNTVKWAMIFQTGLFWVPIITLAIMFCAPAANNTGESNRACLVGLATCVFLVGFIWTWVMMISVVFGETGDACTHAAGPHAGHITRLLWWSKALLWTQIIFLGTACCAYSCMACMYAAAVADAEESN
jgi:hypothetical protein